MYEFFQPWLISPNVLAKQYVWQSWLICASNISRTMYSLHWLSCYTFVVQAPHLTPVFVECLGCVLALNLGKWVTVDPHPAIDVLLFPEVLASFEVLTFIMRLFIPSWFAGLITQVAALYGVETVGHNSVICDSDTHCCYSNVSTVRAIEALSRPYCHWIDNPHFELIH